MIRSTPSSASFRTAGNPLSSARWQNSSSTGGRSANQRSTAGPPEAGPSEYTAALSAVSLLHPYWTLRRAVARLLIDVAGSGIFCWLLQANILASIVIATVPPDKAVVRHHRRRHSSGLQCLPHPAYQQDSGYARSRHGGDDGLAAACYTPD